MYNFNSVWVSESSHPVSYLIGKCKGLTIDDIQEIIDNTHNNYQVSDPLLSHCDKYITEKTKIWLIVDYMGRVQGIFLDSDPYMMDRFNFVDKYPDKYGDVWKIDDEEN